MNEVNRIIIPVKGNTRVQPPRSLTWHGDELVDWVGGCTIYNLDGSISPPRINYAYRFDHAITSSTGECSNTLSATRCAAMSRCWRSTGAR